MNLPNGKTVGIDPDRYRLTPEMYGGLTPVSTRPRSGMTFIRGPISWAWWSEASRSGEAGFRVALGILYLSRRYGRPVLRPSNFTPG
jgi:hypothetical protein